MVNFLKLKGIVYERCGNQNIFAEKCEITPQYASKILSTSNINPTLDVLNKISDTLCLTPEEIKSIFFADEVSQN